MKLNWHKYSHEQILIALSNLEKKYPAVYRHFFLAEVDPVGYKQFMDGLGKENDSRQSDSGLDQEQETYSG